MLRTLACRTAPLLHLQPAAQSLREFTSTSATHAVYVIFGASGGIGSALTARLSKQEDASLILAAESDEALKQIGSTGENAEQHVADAQQFDQVDKLLETVADKHGQIDGIANCIGTVALTKPLHITDDAEYRKVMDNNVLTSFNIIKAAVTRMMRSQEGNKPTSGGSIVLTSAAVSQLGTANHDLLAAAKGAVASLALGAASTYSEHNIRVNCVAPGLVQTPQTEPMSEGSGGEESLKIIPLGRFGTADEAAAAYEFLLHPSNSYITGQTLNVDGGLGNIRVATPGNPEAPRSHE